MISISAEDLKTQGIAAIETALADQPEALIRARGEGRFVVMDLAHYHYLRECELEAALAQTRADLAAERFVEESAEAHMDHIEAALSAESPGMSLGLVFNSRDQSIEP
ncbi:hypothetical protein [uncultured Thiodictyon sp.]|uniref:hypothetical protein n=1 Tax=uncultured Thiodictyon sp. TaxID=1846217 RepID=UPI0025E1987E|nr:hypothetical protein [uncultured Thiodictyon sp.]